MLSGERKSGMSDRIDEKILKQGLVAAYFPTKETSAFEDADEEKREYLKFIDMLCLTAIDINDNHPEIALDRVGSLMSDAELIRALEPHISSEYSGKHEVRMIYASLLRRGKKAIEAGKVMPVSALLLSGYLRHIESLAVLLAYAASASLKYERVFGVLQADKDGAVCPTKGLCYDLGRLFLNDEENDLSILLQNDSFLNTVLLCEQGHKTASEMSKPLKLRSSVLSILTMSDEDMGDLKLCAALMEGLPSDAYVADEAALDELISSYEGLMSGGAGVINISAPEGAGKRFLMRGLAAKSASDVLAVNLSSLASYTSEEQEGMLADAIVRAVLLGDIIYLFDMPDNDPGSMHRILSYLQCRLPVLVIGSNTPLGEKAAEFLRYGIYRITVKEPGDKQQRILWQKAADEVGVSFAEDVDLDEIVSKYTMNPGRIFLAIKNCVSSMAEGGKIHKEELQEQIRRICAVQFGENAKRLKSPFVWEDLIVEPESVRLLKQVCDRVRYKSRVNEDYGFGAKLPYGRGLSVVLYGPPGTGKTMAAQVLANTLGLDIYRIDLSQISSKYIGETEKNLGSVFDAAKNSNAILFFDEADSLFSKRTAVNSSNDRHANAETSYLLQKIEEYAGMSILATNNMQNFDAAFKRRMSYMIPIGIPDEATRIKLWDKAFPEKAPLAKDVDTEILARAVEMSGSNIKAAAVTAAYLAAAQDGEITMELISDAVELECMKNGRAGAKNDILRAMIGG